MFDYPGEGLIKCHICSAMVPSFRSIIDLPGAPEDRQPCFRPVFDATMHNRDCTYCHHLKTMEYRDRLTNALDGHDREKEQERNALTVGKLFDSINDHLVARTPDLLKVAEIGKYLLIAAICSAEEQDNAEFFVHAYESAGPVIDAVLRECGFDWRDSWTGHGMQRANDER